MILTDREIQIALERGQIKIDPAPSVDAYSSTSVDLTLDSQINEFRDDLGQDGLETIIDAAHSNYVAERTLAKITRPVPIGSDGYLLVPRKLILAWTHERVVLPVQSRLAARVEGKSSLARAGLAVHLTAPTIHSGFAYPIRLEMMNHGVVPIRLRAGMKICQLIFELTFGTPQKGFQPIHSAPLPEVR